MARVGLSQEKLGEALGMSQAQVSQRLAGRIDWRISEIQAIAKILNIPISTLITDAVADGSAVTA
jgi:transcriptional regulator with XRE-family HTH domain